MCMASPRSTTMRLASTDPAALSTRVQPTSFASMLMALLVLLLVLLVLVLVPPPPPSPLLLDRRRRAGS